MKDVAGRRINKSAGARYQQTMDLRCKNLVRPNGQKIASIEQKWINLDTGAAIWKQLPLVEEHIN